MSATRTSTVIATVALTVAALIAPGSTVVPILAGTSGGTAFAQGTVTSVSLRTSARNLPPGTAGSLSGVARRDGDPAARVAARIDYRQAGTSAWRTFARVKTTASGRFSYPITPRRATEYWAVISTSGHRIAASTTHAVTVQDASTPLAGVIVALDPGHNGNNAAATRKRASDGRGHVKTCNTSGTSTNTGYSEHAFNWDVAKRTQTLLRDQGATVIMTRTSDLGAGPCVDIRGKFARDHDANLLVSIHANGTTNQSAHGFFAIVSSPPLRASQRKPSEKLAADLINALDQAKFARSSSMPGALSKRRDLGTLNFASRPAVLLELGEMRNRSDAAVMRSAQGRARYARAIARGIERFVTR